MAAKSRSRSLVNSMSPTASSTRPGNSSAAGDPPVLTLSFSTPSAIIPNRMTENTRAGLESWLRYADELGLGPYYRDRAPSKSFPSAPAAAPAISLAATASATSAQFSAAAPRRSPQSTAPAAAAAKLTPLIQAPSGPSLFEERIENDSLERIRADIGDCTRCKLHKA